MNFRPVCSLFSAGREQMSPWATMVITLAATMAVSVCLPSSAVAVDEFEHAPILYSRSRPQDCVAQLQERLEAGQEQLEYDEQFGYLKSVLKSLDVPADSQMLVFSKTSLQMRRISPKTPRAIYFNDDVYIGYCHQGDVLEFSAVDPQLGAVFYTLEQIPGQAPRFERRTDNCLLCHASTRTGGVPGHVVRSMSVDADGQPIYSAGSHSVDHTTPMKDRWGGWYVTGRHGEMPHLGNLISRGRTGAQYFDNSNGHNVLHLGDRLDVQRYLTPHSDIVALMVLEHQTLVHNRLTKANYAARQALDYQVNLNKALGNAADEPLESTKRRIASAGDELIKALLLVDEAPLTSAVSGTSGFEARFAAQGPRDRRGRSLRDLNLQTRLFKHPCSYLIYSPAFRQLPSEMRDYLWQELGRILQSGQSEKRFAHLSADDRANIVQILRETHPDVPEGWPSGDLDDRSAASPDAGK